MPKASAEVMERRLLLFESRTSAQPPDKKTFPLLRIIETHLIQVRTGVSLVWLRPNLLFWITV
jgi:hypothetical protein